MKIVLESAGRLIGEFGFFKLTDPPKVISYAAMTFAYDRPLTKITPPTANHPRQVRTIGHAYTHVEPLKLVAGDLLTEQEKADMK